MSQGLEQRVERMEDALQTVLAMTSRTQAQIALLAQISGTALARACANTANPPVIMEQILQLIILNPGSLTLFMKHHFASPGCF